MTWWFSGSSPGEDRCVLFLSKTFHSHRVPLHARLDFQPFWEHTAVKRGARAQFPPKLSLKQGFSKIFAFKPKVKTVAEKLSFKLRI